jgi:hypothetical protein
MDGIWQYMMTGIGVAASVLMPTLSALMTGKDARLPQNWLWMLLGSFCVAALITLRSDAHSPQLTAEQRKSAQEGKIRNRSSRLRGSFERGMGWQALIGGIISGATGGQVAVGIGGHLVASL